MDRIIEEIMDWNEDRDNLDYNCIREADMLQEEVDELYLAFNEGTRVDEADALADVIVVAVGGLYKLCGGDRQKFNDIMLAVTAANNTKSSTKNSDGKITKPDNFVGPEFMIESILNAY